MTRPIVRKAGLALVAASLALTLQACRENEQERPLSFEKGVYSGEPDQKLSAEQTDELRRRASQIQQF
ncbi:hypothetical protein ACKTEK_03835 [Tepidamorphus sp. 3E244]|uniref:hypothetical protein n=1 Tax=Tepidamorphus sp. 3E244 TaxID=3385498 RepID=UPI0038FCE2B4